jgi:hypothetical protein
LAGGWVFPVGNKASRQFYAMIWLIPAQNCVVKGFIEEDTLLGCTTGKDALIIASLITTVITSRYHAWEWSPHRAD